MKKTTLRIVVLLLFNFQFSTVFAQVPQAFKYQAIARNNSGAILAMQPVNFQISILQGSAIGNAVYIETQKDTTNQFGLANLKIGAGTVVQGVFTEINWGNDEYFVKIELDATGGINFQLMGVSQLLSVPYALYAKTAENISGTITEIQISDLGTYIETETQNLADVIVINNSADGQIKNLTDPTDPQDAATKAYVDILLARIEVLELLNNGFTDSRDGNNYDVVKIGNQVWMAENLKYLPSVVGSDIGSQTNPYYYVYGYNGTIVANAKATANYTTYGVLYNWTAAMNGATSSTSNPSGVQGVCPTGWHLPSNAEETELFDYLGGISVAGGKLKEIGTTHWTSPNTLATNETGFTALPGGHRHVNGTFVNIGGYGYWWNATDASCLWGVGYILGDVFRSTDSKALGLSVRCVRD